MVTFLYSVYIATFGRITKCSQNIVILMLNLLKIVLKIKKCLSLASTFEGGGG